MLWEIVFHPDVLKEDLPRIDVSIKKDIFKAIEKKLPINPEAYGEPLRKELFGFWKLKVGPWRVIYRIYKEKVVVYIVKIGPRRDNLVYKEMLRRARKLLKG